MNANYSQVRGALAIPLVSRGPGRQPGGEMARKVAAHGPTMVDVARRAGVSQSCVSLVLISVSYYLAYRLANYRIF